jgi:cation transport protein ChaC
MALTPEHVALCHRGVADSGPQVDYDYLEDADYKRAAVKFLAERPAAPFWLFAYGSLIWKPEFETEATWLGVAEGWQRCFCLHLEG